MDFGHALALGAIPLSNCPILNATNQAPPTSGAFYLKDIFMDRQICYIGAIPQDTDLLQQNKNVMIGLGYALQAIIGSSTVVDGLACTQNGPPAMNVLVAPGSIYSLQNVDGTAYGSIIADTADQIIKQGIVMTATTLACPAPVTGGQSVVYLVQAAYQDSDAGPTVLPYYNASNPTVAWSGPNNTGVSQNTARKGLCVVSVKTGVAATTGTQVTPSPDAGYTGLYAVTVANGATTVTSGNIQTLATAPFIATKLPSILTAIQQDKPNYALDTSVSANTITVALSPIPAALSDGMVVRVKVANSSTGATVMNVNALGNVACNTTSGSAFGSNTVVANGIYTFVYDANGTRFQLQGFTAASATGLIPANNLSDVSSVSTSRTNLGLGSASLLASSAVCQTANNLSDVASAATARGNLGAAALASPTFTGTPAAPTASAGTNTTQIATTAFVKNAVLFGATFTSAQQTISAAGSLTIAHGLGKVPFLITTTIVCQSSEFGYSTGDELLVSMGAPYSATSTTAEGAAITMDATNIYVKFTSDIPLNNMLNKSTGATVILTLANWKLVVKAVA